MATEAPGYDPTQYDDESDQADLDYCPSGEKRRGGPKANAGRSRKRKKRASAGAAVLSDDDVDLEDTIVNNPHRIAGGSESDEEEDESSDSEIDRMFREMQQEAAATAAGSKPAGKAESKAAAAESATATSETGPKGKPSSSGDTPAESPSRKRLRVQGVDMSAPAIDFSEFESDNDESSEDDGKTEVRETRQFAGETVVVKKIVSKNSKEARRYKRRKKGDLDSILLGLKGTKQINTLDKCQIDWEKDKDMRGDRDELEFKSKNGELDKRRFLQEVDFKQFERERDARNEQRRKQGIIL